MTYPFLYDTIEEDDNAREDNAITQKEQARNRGERAKITPFTLAEECLIAKERAEIDVDLARIKQNVASDQLFALEPASDEANAEIAGRRLLIEHPNKDILEIIRLVEHSTASAKQERYLTQQTAFQKKREAYELTQESLRVQQRVLLHLIRQSAGETTIEAMRANNGWAWRHLAKDVNVAMAPHVRDNLGRQQQYYFQELRIARNGAATEHEAKATSDKAHNEGEILPKPQQRFH